MGPLLSTQPGAESTASIASTGSARGRVLIQNYAIFLVFILLLIAGSVLSDRFLTGQNLLNIGQSVAFTGFAALGMLFVTTSGVGAVEVPQAATSMTASATRVRIARAGRMIGRPPAPGTGS